MLTDYQIIQIAAATYLTEFPWDEWSEGDVTFGIKHVGGFDIAGFRGSLTQQDWFNDIKADIYMHPLLGNVHRGFSEGIDLAYDLLLPKLKNPIILTGHSLGAAHAALIGGILAARNIPVSSIVLAGCPRPGGSQLSEILLQTPITSFKNRFDPVTDVPLPQPGGYCHVRSMIPLDEKPADDDIEPFSDHHCYLYQAGIQRLEAPHEAA